MENNMQETQSMYRNLNKCLNCKIRSKIFCDKLNEDCLDQISKEVRHENLPKGSVILSQNDDIFNIFNIIHGIIKVYQLNENGDEQIIGFLYPGDFFGSHEGGRYEFYAQSITPVKLCKIPIKEFKKYLSLNKELHDSFYVAVVNELKLARMQINILAKYSAEEKVLDFLKMISVKQVGHGQPENPINLQMTRSDIANYLGLKIETVSRAITKLRVKNIINVNENGLLMLN